MEKHYVLRMMEADVLIRRVVEAQFDAIVLAISLGICMRTLERAFRERFGCTPAYGIEVIRLNIACALAESGLRTKDIAYALGYRQVSHFCQRFKRVFGRSPRTWKNAKIKNVQNTAISLLAPSLSLKHNLLELFVNGNGEINTSRKTIT
jgi:transcriptional regulator GlxA family with amidase domain